MQLKVIKADGSCEDYFHTKIIGAISGAIAASGGDSSFVAEQFADAITYYLYNSGSPTVNSGQIYSIIQAILSATGFEDAAIELTNHHLNRELARRRTEVVDGQTASAWNKSQIVFDLAAKGFEPAMARAIASRVEEKVLLLAITKAPKSLIREIVEIETKAMLEASAGLQLCSKA